MFRINVITQLILFILLAIVINQLKLMALLPILFILICFIALNKVERYINTLKRFKWLFLVLMIIYAFNTPGEHIHGWPFDITPTYEGVIAGISQAIRISAILAIISWIMAVNTKQQLVSGFYFILSPFKLLGLQTERFAARLWLTLHYVELQNVKSQDKTNNNESLMVKLENISKFKFGYESKQMDNYTSANGGRNVLDVVEFVMPRFQIIDYLTMAGMVFFLIRVIL